MKATRSRLPPSAVLAVLLCCLLGASAQAQPTTIALRGATLIDGTGAPPQAATTILIRDGEITAVTPDDEAEVPAGARVIDVSGQYVIPGLADMHVHFASGGRVARDPQTPDRVLRQLLSYGVTTVLNVGATGGGAGDIVRLREKQASGTLTAPHLYATGHLMTVPGSHPTSTIMRLPDGADPETYAWSRRGVAVVETPDDVRDVVRSHAEQGMDGIKIVVESGPLGFGDDHPQMSPALIQAAVDEAAEFDLPVFAHVSSTDELEDAVEAGVRGLAHAVVHLPLPGPEHWTAMREKNVFYVPTLAIYGAILSARWREESALRQPFLEAGIPEKTIRSMVGWRHPAWETPQSERSRAWKAVLQSLDEAHEAGVALAFGTDTGNPFVFPGYSAHVELELMVQAGLTPMEALIAATRRPAEMLGKADIFGTIEPGKRADLLVLDADPLEDIRNTRTLELVIRGGEVIDRSSLLPDE